jgi:hypothetical protein
MANGSSDPIFKHAISEREETMNALRKFRIAILLSSLSVLALGTIATPAQAGK